MAPQTINILSGLPCIEAEVSGMQEDEEHIVEDQPLKVLDLFPKREPQQIQITVDKFSKLFEHLTCTICRELFKTPVYLKCSHRFCKECIEKYIRSSTKRSCPNCRGELTTKRDLHSDYLTESFIRFAFNDPKAFTTAIERADQFEILKGKTNELRRLESQPDIKSKLKEINEESSVPVPKIKRTKTEGEQPKKRGRKSASEKRIESKAALEREEKEIEESVSNKPSKNQEKGRSISQALVRLKLGMIQAQPITPVVVSSELMKPEIYRSSDKSRKKKIEVIQIDSNSEHERDVEQIRRQEFFPEEENDICSIHHIAEELPERQQEKQKIFSFRDIKQMEVQECGQANYIERNIKHQQDKEQYEEIVAQPEPMLAEEEAILPKLAAKPTFETNPDVVRALSVLREQFGDNFQSKVIELTVFPFYGEIEVRKLPSSLITPILAQSCFKLSLRTSLSAIESMIADMLNINKQWIKLFVLEEGRVGQYRELAVDTKLYQVNQQYWRRWRGVELVQQGQLLREQFDRGLQSSGEGRQVLFYSVDFSRARP